MIESTSATSSACAHPQHGAVVASVATAEFAPFLDRLAQSVVRLGYRCLVSIRGEWPSASETDIVLYLQAAVGGLKPRPIWCEYANGIKYGWRLTHLLKVRLMQMVLADRQTTGMLILDSNYHFVAGHDPVPSIAALGLDVVSGRDSLETQLGHLNLGRTWLRATNATRALADRVANRTWGSWDQVIFNEELDFNHDLSSITCCHSATAGHLPCAPESVLHDAESEDRRRVAASRRSASARAAAGNWTVSIQRRCRDDQPPPSQPPPNASKLKWPSGWSVDAYNYPPTSWRVRGRLRAERVAGRCSTMRNQCPPCA